MANLAPRVQARHVLTARIKELVLSEIGADSRSTKVYKITLFRDSTGECQVCVCLYHDNFTKLVIKRLNKLNVQLEECRERFPGLFISGDLERKQVCCCYYLRAVKR